MLLHTSPDFELKKNWRPMGGRFGGCLFFVNGYSSKDAYVMTAGKYCVYAISDEDEDNLKIARRWDLDIAEELEERLDTFTDAEDSWNAQAELLRAAVEQGYDGVEDEDEQGAVYLINGDAVIEMMSALD